jgi:molybdopterin/thiamine biosynthesis adenylyltransferase
VDRNVIIVGVGNIGSFLVDLLARDSRVGKLTIIDRDVYTAANLPAQNIETTDIGRSKAQVAARRAQRIAGTRVAVTGYQADLAALPWGIYRRADVVISCLDSRTARIQLATICWRMGRPLLDCGVNAAEHLARVTWFVPSSSNACYMCTIPDWSNVEGTFTCSRTTTTPTGAPAYLGATAAALAAARVHDRQDGQEVVFNTQHTKTLASRHVRNSACPFDHVTWQINTLPINPFVATWGPVIKRYSANSVGVAGDVIVTELVCAGCGAKRSNLVTLRQRGRPRRCGRCGEPLDAPGTAMHEQLKVEKLPAVLLNQELAVAGIADGDILTFDGAKRYEIQARSK